MFILSQLLHLIDNEKENDEGSDDQKSNTDTCSSEGNNEDSQKLNSEARIVAGKTSVFMNDDESDEEYHDMDKIDTKSFSSDPAQTRKPGSIFVNILF